MILSRIVFTFISEAPKRLSGCCTYRKEIVDWHVSPCRSGRALEVWDRDLQMSEFEYLDLFLVSRVKSPQLSLKGLYLTARVLGAKRDKDGAPILYVDPH